MSAFGMTVKKHFVPATPNDHHEAIMVLWKRPVDMKRRETTQSFDVRGFLVKDIMRPTSASPLIEYFDARSYLFALPSSG